MQIASLSWKIRASSSLAQHLISQRTLGWLLFILYLIWFYRVPPWLWFTHLPNYGDVVEAVWQIDFWRGIVLNGDPAPVSYAAMWPRGTHMFTIAHNGVALLLLPAAVLFGSVFATNLGYVAGYLICFTGFLSLLKRFTSSYLLASIGSVIATFALGRTVAIRVHLNIALASAFAVWLLLFIVKLRGATGPNERCRYALLAGLAWGISVICQPYFIFIPVPLLMLIVAPKRLADLIRVVLVTALVAGPYLLTMRSGQEFMSHTPHSLAVMYPPGTQATFQATSPAAAGWMYTVWTDLAKATKELRQKAPLETFAQNWGILIWLFVLPGIAIAIRERSKEKLSIAVALVIAFILALGPLWINAPTPPGLSENINRVLWRIGSAFKPALFDGDPPDHLIRTSFPLPAALLYTLVPFYEMVRVPGRFLIVVGFAAVILSISFLSKLPLMPRVALGFLWLIELLPQPTPLVPAPRVPHPAHQWVAENYGNSAIGVLSPSSPLWVYSAHLAKLKGTGTIGSFAPSYTMYTAPWIYFSHGFYTRQPPALASPEHVNVLVRAQVKIALLTPEESTAAMRNPHLRFISCFDPPQNQAAIYKKTALCAFEVTKDPAAVDFNVQPIRGFSGFESGADKPDHLIWVDGLEAEAGWWLTSAVDHELDITMRAFCPANQNQTANVLVNNVLVTQLSWSGDCWTPRLVTVALPRTLLKQGWNAIRIEALTANRPMDYLEGSNDRRRLSVALERLHVRVNTNVPHLPTQQPRVPPG